MKLQSIQALRGLAALLVVIYHIRALELKSFTQNGLTETAWVTGLFTNGYAGVDLFFVISGFIMVYVTQRAGSGLLPAADFLFARVTRIYPVWWAFAGIMALYVMAAYGDSGAGWAKASNGQPAGPYLIRSFLLLPQPAFPLLSVGWTLVHEVYFYLVFTLLMLAPRRFLPAGLAVWGVLVGAASVCGIAKPYAEGWLTLAVHPMTAEFILGAGAGLSVTAGRVRYGGVLTLVATLWLLTGLCYQGAEDSQAMMWGRVVWFGLPSALLVYAVACLDLTERRAWLIPALAALIATTAVFQLTGLDGASPPAERRTATILAVTTGGLAMLATIWFGSRLRQRAPQRVVQARPMLTSVLAAAARLGDWSFALYLSHLIVLSVLRNVFEFLGRIEPLAPVFLLGHPGRLDNMAFVALGLPLTILVSWLTYRLFERPVTLMFGTVRRRLFRRGQALAVSG